MTEQQKTVQEVLDDCAESFAVVFDESDEHAQRVMQVLGLRFGYAGRSLYDRDAKDPGSETHVRAGHQEVLQFIVTMIARGKSDAKG